MKSDTLKAIEEELARQNEALATFESILTSLGDVELQVGPAFFRELEEACATRTIPSAPTMFGLKG